MLIDVRYSIHNKNSTYVKVYHELVPREGESMNLEMHLKQLEECHLSGAVRESGEALGHILADDFVEFGSSGKVFTRHDFVDGASLHTLTLHDWTMHQLGEQAALTTYRVKNHCLNRETLRSSIWKYDGTDWKLFFHQGTIANEQTKE